MATIEIPEDSIVARLEITGDLTEEEINRFLGSFASGAVAAGLEQATFATSKGVLGVAW